MKLVINNMILEGTPQEILFVMSELTKIGAKQQTEINKKTAEILKEMREK